MGEFREYFNSWVNNKVDYQLDAIDKICVDVNIYPNQWFSKFLSRTANDCSGVDFLNDMLSDFIWYLSREFQKPLLQYIKPEGYNIYNEPYLSISLHLKYDLSKGLYIKKNRRKKFQKFCKVLTLTQKEDLMNDKLFSYIISETNIKFFTKKEMRTLKLKKINSCQTE